MYLNYDSEKPLYLQLAESLEDGILNGHFPEESPVLSTTELSLGLQINPATAAKGMNLLVEEGVLYKRRGVGMFVKKGARDIILTKRKARFQENFLLPTMEEAQKLSISTAEVVRMLEGLAKERSSAT